MVGCLFDGKTCLIDISIETCIKIKIKIKIKIMNNNFLLGDNCISLKSFQFCGGGGKLDDFKNWNKTKKIPRKCLFLSSFSSKN